MAKKSSIYRNLKRIRKAEKFAAVRVDRRDQRQKHFSGRKIQESVEISRTAPQFVEGSH